MEIRNIETKAKPQEINKVASGVSNNLWQKETLILNSIGQRKEKAEELIYSDRGIEVKRNQQPNWNTNKTENFYGQNEQHDIKSETCINCDKYVYTDT